MGITRSGTLVDWSVSIRRNFGQVLLVARRNHVGPVNSAYVLTTRRRVDVRQGMKLSRLEGTGAVAPSVASRDWLEAFETQCTKGLQKKARRLAVRRARKLILVGGVVDDYYVEGLVQDVLGDTALGILRWDPSSESLEDHVMDAIATRVHHDVVRAKRYPHASLDATDPEASRATLAAAEAALLAEREASAATVGLAEDVFGELWELAAEDPDLLRFLGALAMGATCKADVMVVADMSDHDYAAARHRLDRLVGRLPRNAQPSRPRFKKGADAIPQHCAAAVPPPAAETCMPAPRYHEPTENAPAILPQASRH